MESLSEKMGRDQIKSRIGRAIFGGFYFLLILCSYYMLKPLRDSSFLTAFHPHAKPLFNLVTMVLLFFAAGFYNSVVSRFQGRRFVWVFYGSLLSNLLLFWWLFYKLPGVTGAVFYGWLSVANVFLIAVFWTQINAAFTDQNDKLMYVIVGLGGGIGAAFGGKITSAIVPYVGSNNLILVACVVLLFAFLCSLWISYSVEQGESFVISDEDKGRANFRGVLQERYAVSILALVAIGTFVHSIYDYQLSVMVAETLERNKDVYSIFYGDLYYRLNSFSIFAQVLIGPLVLMSIGPARGLYIFVALIVGTAIALSINNSLFVMEWVFIIFVGSGYSFVQIFREQLYVPASQFIKVSCKGFIDTFGFRLGDSLAALSFVIVVSFFGFDAVRLEYLVLLSSLVACYFLFQANRLYNQLTNVDDGEGG